MVIVKFDELTAFSELLALYPLRESAEDVDFTTLPGSIQ
jgi:hypothetical protein